MADLLGRELSLHDVRDVEAFVRRVADRQLQAWGAYLRTDDYEDLISYLVGKAWELSEQYDPEKGPSFSTYSARILWNRVVDWYRGHFGDSRYRSGPPPLSLEAWVEVVGSEVYASTAVDDGVEQRLVEYMRPAAATVASTNGHVKPKLTREELKVLRLRVDQERRLATKSKAVENREAA
jgi:DNA-directed RNA polymerase specialized sigma24 family protein